MSKQQLLELADRVERRSLPYNDELLDIEAAEALGYQQRRVTRLGLNGRTPGSYLWFAPKAPFGGNGSRKPPKLTGPKRSKTTAASLRAIAAMIEDE